MTIATHPIKNFDTDILFTEWSTLPDKVFFSSDDLASIARSFDDFKHGRTLSIDEVEVRTNALIEGLYTPAV